jgi:hypothetical protein
MLDAGWLTNYVTDSAFSIAIDPKLDTASTLQNKGNTSCTAKSMRAFTPSPTRP